jgi:hypothetical protein
LEGVGVEEEGEDPTDIPEEHVPFHVDPSTSVPMPPHSRDVMADMMTMMGGLRASWIKALLPYIKRLITWHITMIKGLIIWGRDLIVSTFKWGRLLPT